MDAVDEVVGHTFGELVKRGTIEAEAAERSIERYNIAAQSERPMDFENQLVWNGLAAFIITTITPVRDDLGRCNRLICWSRDLSRRRQREQQLAESEANFRSVVEGTSDAVWVMTAVRMTSTVFAWRTADARTSRAHPGAGCRKPLHEFLTKPAAEAALRRYAEAEAAGEPIEYENVVERGGVRTDLVTHLTPLVDENGRCYRIIGSARDVSDRRRAETALLQAQKFESLGVLAGGIAHDFNNLLTAILGNLFLLESELPDGSPLAAYANDSKLAAERGADLVRRLLGFSRPGLQARDAVSLDHLLHETGSLLQRTLGPEVRLVLEPGPDNDTTYGEFSALQQVLVNLFLQRARRHADGGRISVVRREREIPAEQLWAQRGIEAGVYHEILVSDSGTGMSRDVMQRTSTRSLRRKASARGLASGYQRPSVSSVPTVGARSGERNAVGARSGCCCRRRSVADFHHRDTEISLVRERPGRTGY